MPKLRWPTYSEWGLLIAIVAAVACIGFGFSVVYNGMERDSRRLEGAVHAQEREAISHRR